MRYVLLCLLFLGCASGAPTTYSKGTLRPPPAPARPGVGLPLPGHPARGPDVQPNPRPTRVLPPSREPGIWAGDEPKASGDIPTVFVLDVPLALPAFRDPELDIGVAHDCKDRLPRGFAADPELKGLVARLSQEERMCWVATVMQFCAHLKMQSYLADLQAEGIAPHPADPFGRSLRGLFDGAKQLRDLMCPGLDERKMFALKTRWENLELGSPKGKN
jgi:hypothetical protein